MLAGSVRCLGEVLVKREPHSTGFTSIAATRDEGVTAIEYALIAGLVLLVIVLAVKAVGIETSKPYQSIGAEMSQ